MFKMDNSYLSKKLLSQLNIIKTSRLTLIEAPSGFGKTTSVRTYLNKEEFNDTIEQIKSSVQLMQYFDKPIHINFEKEINGR